MRYTLIVISLIFCFVHDSPVYAEASGGGSGSITSDIQFHSNTTPREATNLTIEIPKAWIEPIQATIGQKITFYAEVRGVDISEVKAYYDLGLSGLIPLSELTDGDGDGVYTGSFTLPSIQAGIYSQFRIIASNSNGSQAVWPGVEVAKLGNDSAQADFAGKFNLTDPTRTYFEYHGDTNLKVDGTGKVREFISGRLIDPIYPETMDNEGYLPVYWSYDSNTKTFIFDWSLNGQLFGLGRFEGILVGNTSIFTLTGHWANGSPGQLTLQRIP